MGINRKKHARKRYKQTRKEKAQAELRNLLKIEQDLTPSLLQGFDRMYTGRMSSDQPNMQNIERAASTRTRLVAQAKVYSEQYRRQVAEQFEPDLNAVFPKLPSS